MAYKKSAKQLYAEIDKPILTRYRKQRSKRKHENNAAVTAALKLWNELPKDIQSILISCDCDLCSAVDLLARQLRKSLQKIATQPEQPKLPKQAGRAKSG
jgi:hypothetical protein